MIPTASLVKSKASPAILESYEIERRDHAWSLIETALALGVKIQPIDRAQAEERDAFFAELNKDPAAIQQIEDDMASSLLLRDVGNGLAVEMSDDSVSGKLIVQPRLKTQSSDSVLLDDLLGDDFYIIGYECDPQEVLGPETIEQWNQFGVQYLRLTRSSGNLDNADAVDINGELTEWLGAETPTVLLVRPDKFCMAVVTPEKTDTAFQKALGLLGA